MKKPDMHDFNVTREQLEEYENQKTAFMDACTQVKRRNIRLYAILAALFLALVIMEVIFYALWGGVYYIVMFSIMGAFVIYMVSMCFVAYRTDFTKKMRRAMYVNQALEAGCERYNTAMEEYKKHIRAINRAYWEKLGADNFTKEAVELFKKGGYTVESVSPNIVLYSGKERIVVECKTAVSVPYMNIVKLIADIPYYMRVNKVIIVAKNGYNFDKDDEYNAGLISIERVAKEKNVFYELWQIPDLIKLSYETGSLILDPDDVADSEISNTVTTHETTIEKNYPAIFSEMYVGRAIIHRTLGSGTIEELRKETGEVIVKFKDDVGGEFKKVFKVPETYDDGTLSFLS